MADCTRTLNFAALGGGIVTLMTRYSGTDVNVRRVPDDLPEAEDSISGHTFLRGATYTPKHSFPHLGWIVSATQRDLIMDGFGRCNRGLRLLTPQQQTQFFVEDEIEEIEDSNPPERAYVAGTLRTIDPGTGSLTTRHKPIFRCYFETRPTFKPTTAKPWGNEQHYEMTMTLGEGDIYLASEQLTPPTTTFSLSGTLSANTNTSGGPVQFAVVS